jgi:CRP/FNR family transcriptional regulator, cyclic AMP receptor protein
MSPARILPIRSFRTWGWSILIANFALGLKNQKSSSMLKTIPLFSTLSEDELSIVKGLSVERSYPKGAIILSEGDIGDSLYAIGSGKVKVYIGDSDGREIILKLLGPGDFFGELSVIDKRPRSASVITIEPSTFRILSERAFEECISRMPSIAKHIMQGLAHRVRDADRKIGSLGLLDVYGRVARTLEDLAVESNGKRVVIEKISQQDLANMVGASREMVNRILKDLAERGFITVEPKAITIIHRELPPSL